MLGKPVGGEDLAGAERGDLAAQRLVAHRGGDPGAGRDAELDGRRADAARRAVDAQALARAQARLGEERVVGGGEDLGQRPGGRPVQRLGHRHQLALVHDGELGLPAAADDAHHAVARLEAPGARAERGDLTGELEPRDVGRRPRRRGVGAAALEDVGAVDPRRPDPDEHLARARLEVRVLGDGELAALADRDSPHGLRSNTATHSMCGVWGNMSTGRTGPSA